MKHGAAIALLLALSTGPVLAQEVPPELRRESKRLGVEIVVEAKGVYPIKTLHGDITGAATSADWIKRYAPILAAELKKYPKEFIRKTRLRKIILGERLRFAGQKRTGIPDFKNGWLHLDVKQSSWNKTYQRCVIHHELFHIVDEKDDGILYDDPSWKKLNPRGFRYGSGGKSARGQDQWPLDPKLKGFLNKYSMSGVEEDKATVYANLLVRGKVVRARAKKDPILARKVAAMKQLLRRFSKSIDAGFWKSLDR